MQVEEGGRGSLQKLRDGEVSAPVKDRSDDVVRRPSRDEGWPSLRVKQTGKTVHGSENEDSLVEHAAGAGAGAGGGGAKRKRAGSESDVLEGTAESTGGPAVYLGLVVVSGHCQKKLNRLGSSHSVGGRRKAKKTLITEICC